ncbi:MAG: phosphoribosylglycinamide formyltransferase [Calditrichota bacterium]
MNNLAVFASGRGSNFINIHKNIIRGKIAAKIACLITDNSKAGAIEYAKRYNIAVHTLPPKDYPSPEDFGRELLRVLNEYKISWIILAGYLKMIPENVILAFSNKIMNIHPALLPCFGGKGMYGMNVHRAVFQSGAKISGVTVHLVNEIYDSGPIVIQKSVNIEQCLSPEEIAKKVLKTEHKLYSEAIKKILTTPFRIESNRVVFLPLAG